MEVKAVVENIDAEFLVSKDVVISGGDGKNLSEGKSGRVHDCYWSFIGVLAEIVENKACSIRKLNLMRNDQRTLCIDSQKIAISHPCKKMRTVIHLYPPNIQSVDLSWGQEAERWSLAKDEEPLIMGG